MDVLNTIAPHPAAVSGVLWLIIALPLLGAAVTGLFGKLLGRSNVHLVAVGAVAGSFVLSCLVLWAIKDPTATTATPFGAVQYSVGADLGTWFRAGSFTVTFGLFADHLSGAMLMVITGVGLLIHIYSTGYMAHDDGYWRYFAYLNLFVAAMLTLVLADSLPLLFVGWEGVGLCSYLLIGFWFDDPQKAFAGRKAFITNRVGDFGFLVASFLLVLVVESVTALPPEVLARATLPGEEVVATHSRAVATRGALSYPVLEDTARSLSTLLDRTVVTGPLAGARYDVLLLVILLLFLLGAAGKSAQIPLFVWLPDAMAGPTPVSALIHAATMVTSGVYLFCRLSYLVVLSPGAMATIAIIGAFTALVAALIAFSQNGIKKILAYSTVSQLGFMFLGIGVGAFWAAFLHVVTHALFKACLFLGAGSVMHGNADEEDIKKLGGLRSQMPLTWLTFLVSTFAITGIVPLSGFFSKDAILHAAAHNHVHGFATLQTVAAWVGTLTALATAFYMSRAYLLTFEGPRAPDARVPHAHESGPVMTVPLVILAVGAVVAVVHGIPGLIAPHQTLMQNYLGPVFRTTDALIARGAGVSVAAEPELGELAVVWLRAWIIALVGGGVALYLYGAKRRKLPSALEPLRRFSFNKFYVDEAYDFFIITPLSALSRGLFRVVDSVLIDGIVVRGTAWLTQRAGAALRYLQTGDAQMYAAVMALAMAGGLVWTLIRVLP